MVSFSQNLNSREDQKLTYAQFCEMGITNEIGALEYHMVTNTRYHKLAEFSDDTKGRSVLRKQQQSY